MEGIGTLSPVDVRAVWADEARDFTPWLAENADLLGEALGMDLLHEETEAAVGRYSADLVFREVSTDRLVVVENLFGPSDHDHLGKLIVYAAGLEAGYAVLLAPEFRDEHRAALDWLNSISAEDFGFFGVVLEAWRIGDSLARAPVAGRGEAQQLEPFRKSRAELGGKRNPTGIRAILGGVPPPIPRGASRLDPSQCASEERLHDLPVRTFPGVALQRGILSKGHETQIAGRSMHRNRRLGDSKGSIRFTTREEGADRAVGRRAVGLGPSRQ